MNSLFDLSKLEEHELVDAKELHALCEAKQPFSLWAYHAVRFACLNENEEYVKIDGDYILTKNSAMHIAMMQLTKPAIDWKIYLIERAKVAFGDDYISKIFPDLFL
jgi:phage anti-repressor protein